MFSGLRSGPREPADGQAWYFGRADAGDIDAIADVRTAAADHLTREFGPGPWSTTSTADTVLRHFRSSCLLVARHDHGVVATLRLSTRRPWVMDVTWFTPVKVAIYLTDMAVAPTFQGRGIGRRLLDEAVATARAWPANAVRLDAYDAPAGAAGFYARCGFQQKARVIRQGTALIYFERLL